MFIKKLVTGSEAIRKSIIEMWRRFPIPGVLTIVGAIVSYILVVDRDMMDNTDMYAKIILLINLGAPYLISATLLSERYMLDRFKALLIQFAGVIGLVIYYFILPWQLSDISYIHAARIALFTFIGYIVLFSIPLFKRASQELWTYGGAIIKRLVIAALFSITVWAGLALAFTAIHYLFELNFELGLLLMKIWVIDIWILGAWVVLGGFPKTDELTENNLKISRAISWLLQYVLVPLTSIFFLILYAYLLKIIITWNWPLGGVAQWILGFSAFGLALFIATYPLQEKDGFTWLKIFFRWFFILLIPMTVVLFMAVGFRLKNYGITEERYMIVVGGLWLLAAAVYYIFSKKKMLQAIPYSLAVVFIFVSVAPFFNMFSLSAHSQALRLRGILERNQILVNNQIQKEAADIKFSSEDATSIVSILSFLSLLDSLDKIEPWFGDKLIVSGNSDAVRSEMIKLLGLKSADYTDYTHGGPPYNGFAYFRPSEPVTTVSGYDFVLNDIYLGGSEYNYGYGKQFFLLDDTADMKLLDNKVVVSLNSQVIATFNLEPKLEEFRAKYRDTTPPRKDFEMVVENKAWRAKIFINNLSGSIVDEKAVINSLEVTLLLDKKYYAR